MIMKQKIFSLLVLIMIAVPEAWASWHGRDISGLYSGRVTIEGDIKISENTNIAVLNGTIEFSGKFTVDENVNVNIVNINGQVKFNEGIDIALGSKLTFGGSGGTVGIQGKNGLDVGTFGYTGDNGTAGQPAVIGAGSINISGADVEITGGRGGRRGTATGGTAGTAGRGANAIEGNVNVVLLSGKMILKGGEAGDADGNVTNGTLADAGAAIGRTAEMTIKGGTAEVSCGTSANTGGGGASSTVKAVETGAKITLPTDNGGVDISAGPSEDFANPVSTEDMAAAIATISKSGYFKVSAPPIPDYTHYLIYNNDDTKGAITFTVGEDDSKVENATTAKEEEQVFVTVTPVDGFAVGTVNACTFNNFENAGARRRAPSDGIPLLGDEVTLEPVQGQANTWNFGMPPSSVLVSVTYKKQAAFETQGGNQLAPTAVEGVIAGEDKAIVSPGTVDVVSGGTGLQGIVWYFFTNDGTITADQIPSDGWSKDLPTAAGFTGDTDKDVSVYVWYYIEATPGSGYANSTPVCLEIKLLKNLFAVKMADPTDAEAKNWKIHSGDASESGNVATGLTGLKAGAAVDLVYSGRLKVKSVTATTDAAPAKEPVTLATPLTIEAVSAGTIVVNIDGTLQTGMKYSVNGGTPTLITTTTLIGDLKAGDKVQFYGNGTSTQAYGNSPEVKILGDGDGFKTKVYGNIMSLLDEEGFATKTDLPNASNVFYGLFWGNTTLNDASELLLPATQLAVSCYNSMFKGCSALTAAPVLPATQLAEACYLQMFNGCSALTAAPVLPATQLAEACYVQMFIGCSDLTAAPVLPATTLVKNCYNCMFNNCKKLATVTCLATSGINQDNSTNCWLQNAGSQAEGTKTFNAVSTAEWPSDVNGIPTDWTRVNIDN